MLFPAQEGAEVDEGRVFGGPDVFHSRECRGSRWLLKTPIPEDIPILGERKPLLLGLELDEEWECAVPWQTRVMTFSEATAGEVHPADSCT